MTTPSSRPVALITGGATGIGLTTARVLHAEGYAVLVTGQNVDHVAIAHLRSGSHGERSKTGAKSFKGWPTLSQNNSSQFRLIVSPPFGNALAIEKRRLLQK